MKRILLVLFFLFPIASAWAEGFLPGSLPPDPPFLTVLIERVGGGSGTVTSSPEGIQCPPACSASFDATATVMLTASADDGSAFLGWSGNCVGVPTCTAVVNGYTSITARFTSTATSTSIDTDANPSALGQPVTLTATVRTRSGSGANGTVTFRDGPTLLCERVTLAFCGNDGGCGRGQCKATPPAGDHSIVAEYSGNATYAASHSPPLLQTVAPGALAPNYTGLWWNPSEAGWGISFNHQGDILFATLFTYDATGQPLWLVMSRGDMQPDGKTFGGDLFQASGLPFNSVGAGAAVTRVGDLSVTFTTTERAMLTYTYNGITVTKTIRPQVFGSRAAICVPTVLGRTSLTNYQDLWWRSDDPGWGLAIAHQDNTLFAILFTYTASRAPTWMVMPSGQRRTDGSWSGTLYRANGSPFNALSVAPASLTNIGSMQLELSNGVTAKVTVIFDGTTVIKQATRQVFSSPLPACH